MAHIVILGAGIGGMHCAYELKAALGNKHKITVVNASDNFYFVPSNPWVAIGWRSREDISFQLNPHLRKKNIHFIKGICTKIDTDNQCLILNNQQQLHYDFLVIATGPKLDFSMVPGAGPSAYSASICTTDHAELAWERYQRCLYEPGPIVIGTLPGASCFAPAYEYAFIIDADLRKRKIRHQFPITLVTAEPYIGHMGLSGVGDSKNAMESELRKYHINWISNARITKLDADQVFCEEVNPDGSILKSHSLEYNFTMMIPPFRGVDAVASVPGLCESNGFVIVDEYYRSPMYSNIYSAGICVSLSVCDATPVPTGTPKTGFLIESMVTAIVSNIVNAINGKEPESKSSMNAICLMDMGDSGIAFTVMPLLPPRNVAWMKKGKWVHTAKIAFEKYYLHKMKKGTSEPLYEKYFLKMLGIER